MSCELWEHSADLLLPLVLLPLLLGSTEPTEPSSTEPSSTEPSSTEASSPSSSISFLISLRVTGLPPSSTTCSVSLKICLFFASMSMADQLFCRS